MEALGGNFLKLKWIKSHKLSIIVSIIGAIGGFSYWYFIGCATGSCGITANWYSSAGFGSIIGWIVGDVVNETINKTKL